MSISGGLVGMYSTIGKTLVFVDDTGNELMGVITENVQMLDAKPGEDIRAGKVAVTDEGIVTGSAIIPNYNTNEGVKVIPNGSSFAFSTPDYDYTKLQAVICSFNTNLSDSVSTDKVVLNDNIYDVKSTISLSTVSRQQDEINGHIDFGITNMSGAPCLIRYFMYKELY